jgi:hypothetical protein
VHLKSCQAAVLDMWHYLLARRIAFCRLRVNDCQMFSSHLTHRMSARNYFYTDITIALNCCTHRKSMVYLADPSRVYVAIVISLSQRILCREDFTHKSLLWPGRHFTILINLSARLRSGLRRRRQIELAELICSTDIFQFYFKGALNNKRLKS